MVPPLPSTFFDAIPQDMLPVLVRYLSKRPHSEDSLKFVNHGDALSVLESGGTLSAVARQMFKYLNKMLDKDSPLIDCSGSFCSLANTMASDIEGLYVRWALLGALNHDQFTSLRVLMLHECTDVNAMEQIFTSNGANLRELHLESMSLEQCTIRAIARYCDSLEVLYVASLEYEGTLGRIWRSVGGNLRDLSGVVHEKEFVHIARNCRRLEKITLCDSDNTWTSPNTIELLNALQTLRVLIIALPDRIGPSSPTIDNFRMILSICPSDLRIGVFFTNNDDCVDYIRVIGSRLSELFIDELCPFPSDVIAHLVNVEKLFLSSDRQTSVIQTVFDQRMPKLRDLRIARLDGLKMLPILTRSVFSVHSFTCRFAAQFENGIESAPFKGSTFAQFVSANKQLQSLIVFYECRDSKQRSFMDALMKEMADLMQGLKSCDSLREVYIRLEEIEITDHLETIRNCCVPLRCKRIDVIVNNMSLLPQ